MDRTFKGITIEQVNDYCQRLVSEVRNHLPKSDDCDSCKCMSFFFGDNIATDEGETHVIHGVGILLTNIEECVSLGLLTPQHGLAIMFVAGFMMAQDFAETQKLNDLFK